MTARFLAFLLTIGSLSTTAAQAQELFDTSSAAGGPSGEVPSSGEIMREYHAPDGRIARYPVSHLANNLIEHPSGEWGPQGYETVMLGGQSSVLRNRKGQTIDISPHQALSIWASPYGSYNAGCSLCVFSSGNMGSEGGGQAAISGLDPRRGAYSIANGDNATVAFFIGQNNSLTRMVLPIKAFGPDGMTLEHPLSLAQMAALHHGMYLSTNVRAPDMPAIDENGRPTNWVYAGIISNWTATHISVYGWSVLGAGNARGGKYLQNGLVPETQLQRNSWTNLDTRTAYKTPVAYIGDPGKYFGENSYVVMDMDRVYGPEASSGASSYERDEFDMRFQNIHRDHAASFHGYTLSFECDSCTVSHPFTEDSYGYLVNGPNELPAAYIAQVYGDALEYRGYSTWIPGAGAADPAILGSHHIMTDFASQLQSGNTLHFGARSYHDVAGQKDWRGYDVRLGLRVDGKRVRDRFEGGTPMSDLAWNFGGKIGSICLIQPDGRTAGSCLNGDGSVDVPGALHAREAITKVIAASAYATAPQYGTSNHFQKLAEIAARAHSEGDRVWCHDCLNPGQGHASGTGRWIFMDSASVWRSDDGYPARD
ncbi:hypothetical protein C0V97_11330 [Asaia sp. W19]|uniref:hypothetical protein n=1 Tax=unclassified Asaia TaxID=2685023 RepID=UPI000F8D8BF6|nr:hypothetical protein [Asaia sp. W19]RUT25505.1 hypothetical protein C0V97_11330 [Asaia sp. W19]